MQSVEVAGAHSTEVLDHDPLADPVGRGERLQSRSGGCDARAAAVGRVAPRPLSRRRRGVGDRQHLALGRRRTRPSRHHHDRELPHQFPGSPRADKSGQTGGFHIAMIAARVIAVINLLVAIRSSQLRPDRRRSRLQRPQSEQ